MDPSVEQILRDNYVDGVFHTHVSMVQPKGKFQFNRQNLEDFWDEYCKRIKQDKEERARKMKSILSAILGALVGVFLCALAGVNFSKGTEAIVDVPTDTAVQSQTLDTRPSEQQVQDSIAQFNLKMLQSSLSLCESQLGSARLEAQMEKMKNFRQ